MKEVVKEAVTDKDRDNIIISEPGLFQFRYQVGSGYYAEHYSPWFTFSKQGMWPRQTLKDAHSSAKAKNFYAGTKGTPINLDKYLKDNPKLREKVFANVHEYLFQIQEEERLEKLRQEEERLAKEKAIAEWNEKLKAGAKWWENPILEGSINIKGHDFLLVDNKYVVAGSQSQHGNYVYIIKSDLYSYSYTGLTVKEPYMQAGTLLDSKTLKPDLKATKEFYESECKLSKKVNDFIKDHGNWNNFCGYSGYEVYPDPKQFPKNIPDTEFVIAELNKLLELKGNPDVKCIYAHPVLFYTSWTEPKFKDGEYIGGGKEQKKTEWGWRLAFNLSDEPWAWGAAHVWVTYRPEEYPNEPWRFILSSMCQRQTNWSKYGDQGEFLHMVQPVVTHEATDWILNFMPQLTQKYPKGREPIFHGCNANTDEFFKKGGNVNKIKDMLRGIQDAA